MISRAEAYRIALMKTAGRRFDFQGQPILSGEEQMLLKRAEDEDYADAFQRAIGQEQARQKLAAIFRGERGR